MRLAGHRTGAAKLKSILFVNPLPNYPGWKDIGACMGAEAKTLGIPYSQTGPTGGSLDTTYMLSAMQQGIADKVGALITFPVSGPQFTPVLEQAKKAGVTVLMPLQDCFWGDRYAIVVDPFGHRWSIATHVRDVTPVEMQQVMRAMSDKAKRTQPA